MEDDSEMVAESVQQTGTERTKEKDGHQVGVRPRILDALRH